MEYNINTELINKRREKIRRKIVKLIFIIYWLLIFEGALRKWCFPQIHKILFFSREPFVFMVYWLAWKHRLWPRKTAIFSFGMFLAFVGAIFLFFQVLSNGTSLAALLYGWRNYFLYIPLMFIIGEQFRGEDLKRLIKQTLLIAIPMAILVFKQLHSPVRSFINKSVAENIFYSDTGLQGGGLIRVTGTFTFFHGWQVYMGSIISLVLICWVLPKRASPLRRNLLILSTIAVAVSFSTDITRLPTIFAVCTLLSCLVSSYFSSNPKVRLKARVMPLVLAFFGSVVVGGYFAAAKATRERRFDQPYMQGRTSNMFVDFLVPILYVPIYGGGFGSTTGGGRALGAKGAAGQAENEWRNHIAEAGPILGILYIYFRIWLFWYLFKLGKRAAKYSGNPAALIMLGFVGPVILIWYITSKGTVHGYGWIFAGFCMAAGHLGDRMAGLWGNEPHGAQERS